MNFRETLIEPSVAESRASLAESEREREDISGTAIVKAFENIHIPLAQMLIERLSDDPAYTPHVGETQSKMSGGFLEVTRYLADEVVSLHRDFDYDTGRIFSFRSGELQLREKELLAGQKGRCAAEDVVTGEILRKILQTLEALPGVSAKMLGRMIQDILVPFHDSSLLSFNAYRERMLVGIGSCTKAEQYLLHAIDEEISDGAVLCDDAGKVIAWQKLGRGEPTFITFQEIMINDVRIPKGSIVYLRPRNGGEDASLRKVFFQKKCITADDVESVRFFRVSLLGIPPNERSRVAETMVEDQQANGSLNAEFASLDALEARVRQYMMKG